MMPLLSAEREWLAVSEKRTLEWAFQATTLPFGALEQSSVTTVEWKS